MALERWTACGKLAIDQSHNPEPPNGNPLLNGAGMNKETIASTNAPPAIGPYSPGIKLGDALFLSGQLGIDSATGKLPKRVGSHRKQPQKIAIDNNKLLKNTLHQVHSPSLPCGGYGNRHFHDWPFPVSGRHSLDGWRYGNAVVGHAPGMAYRHHHPCRSVCAW